MRPDSAVAHTNLGDALRAKGKVDEAIACYRRAIALDPNFAQAHYNLGVVLENKGKVAVTSTPGRLSKVRLSMR
jgi:tetratricopeptide (TPR) repeat protein